MPYDPAVPPIFYDTETCGFHGPVVLIQYAIGDGPIILHEPWVSPIHETLALIEQFMAHPGGVVGFNLTFDHFHLCQLYTTLSLLNDRYPLDLPEDRIDEYALLESEARTGPCLKPVAVCDLMVFARKGPYQSTMNRGPIRIRRVPNAIAWQLAAELEERIKLAGVYFAKKKNKYAARWKVYDSIDKEGEEDVDFKDVVLSFSPSAALKVLAMDALKIPPDQTLLFADVEIDKSYQPVEMGYAPFAMAIGKPGNWKGAWPDVIKHHIGHWGYSQRARKYAEKDVEYTRGLYYHFGKPDMDDDDSQLTCMVGAVRWKGFRIDPEGLKEQRKKAVIRKGKHPIAPAPARRYIQQVMDPVEKLVMKGSTKKTLLEEVSTWHNLPCTECDGSGKLEIGVRASAAPKNVEELFASLAFDPELRGDGPPCDTCKGKGSITHPAAIRAKHVLGARKAGKEIELYDKLLAAGRLHADFVVTGTLSNRMAGSGGLNAQGIRNSKEVRGKFPLADPDTILCGGDFAGFEVVLAIACYNDPDLRKDVLTKRPCPKCMKGKPTCACQEQFGLINGKPCKNCFTVTDRASPACDECRGTFLGATKIHALFGQFVYPHMTYEEIMADKDIYTRCKSAVFAMLYGGEAFTLKERLAVPIEIAEKAYEQFGRRYPGVAIARKRIINMFSCLVQKKEFGKIEWNEPEEYIESMFGFRRFFTLENMIIRALYDLANTPPKAWRESKARVQRDKRNTSREQTASGATQSALFGAAFALQASNIRAAANHEIQSSGATITKFVQRRIWDIQPSGIHPWLVQPFNVHDELMCPTHPDYVSTVKETVDTAVESFRPKVPLIEMEWNVGLNTWGEK